SSSQFLCGYTVRVSRPRSVTFAIALSVVNRAAASAPKFGRGGTLEKDRIVDSAHHGNTSLYTGLHRGGSRTKSSGGSGPGGGGDSSHTGGSSHAGGASPHPRSARSDAECQASSRKR